MPKRYASQGTSSREGKRRRDSRKTPGASAKGASAAGGAQNMMPLIDPDFVVTATDHAFFAEVGYLVKPKFLLPAAIDYIRSAMEQVYRDLSPAVHDEWVMSLHQTVTTSEDNWLWRVATAPSLLDAVERILGTPDIVLFSTQLATKRPGQGTEVPWHQDGERCCTVWIPLDDVSDRTGALRVLPGMHKHGRLPFRHLDPSDDLTAFEFFHQYHLYETCIRGLTATPTTLSLPAGGVEIHNPALPHSSGPNRSRHRWRRALVLRYQPATEPLVSGDIRHWRSGRSFSKLNYLVRGQHPLADRPADSVPRGDAPHLADDCRAGIARRPGGEVWYIDKR